MNLAILSLLVVVPLIALGLYWAMRASVAQRRVLDDQWQAYATTRGFTLLPAERRWFQALPTRVVGNIAGVGIVLSTYVQTSGSDEHATSTTFTRLQAHASHGLDVKVKVYRAHFLSGLGKLLGFHDVQTGDATFDETFLVKASDEDRALELLSADARRTLLRFPKSVTLTYDRGELVLLWEGHETSGDVLDTAIGIGAAVCGRQASWHRG